MLMWQFDCLVLKELLLISLFVPFDFWFSELEQLEPASARHSDNNVAKIVCK